LNLSFVQAQVLEVTPENDSDKIIENFIGEGIEVSNVQFNCPEGAAGFFDGSNSNIGLNAGVLLTTGLASNAVGPNDSSSISWANETSGDADLTILANQGTFDACALEFDFVPLNNVLTFRYVLVQKNIWNM